MNSTGQPNAFLLVSNQCPHCHAMEKLLRERIGKGTLAELETVNIEQSPNVAAERGVRSVPWLKLGNFIFDEVLTPAELDQWIELAAENRGQSSYIRYLLEHGKLVRAIEWLEQGNASLKNVIPLMTDPETKINVRVGVGAILEHFENTQAIKTLIPNLIGLLHDDNPVIRTDACHYLSLTHSHDAVEPLRIMLDDKDPQVQEVARDSIEELLRQ